MSHIPPHFKKFILIAVMMIIGFMAFAIIIEHSKKLAETESEATVLKQDTP